MDMDTVRERSPIRETNEDGKLIYHIQGENLPEELKMMFTTSRCDLCSVQITSQIAAQQHFHGKSHLKAVRAWLITKQDELNMEDDLKYCKHCNLIFSSVIAAHCHYNGRRHKKTKETLFEKMKQMDMEHDGERRFGIGDAFKPPEVEPQTDPSNMAPIWPCSLCNIMCPNKEALQSHLLGAKHKKKLASLAQNGNSLEKEKPHFDDEFLFNLANIDLTCCQQTFDNVIKLIEHYRSSHVPQPVAGNQVNV